ncbi:TPM domain-containing protein [Dongia sp.]|uniref:TPM domain-containing protein n=1 Tax=Dongia sp. TaxID=1977262 RepID=UPI00374FDEDF
MVRILGFLVLLVGFAAPVLAGPPIPTLTGRVMDLAGILDRATIDAVTQQSAAYEASTGGQLVVVTLPSLQGYPIEDWGLALGRGWGIGRKGKNDGVLLIVAPKDRALRIEVGYGLEGQIPDATANTIIQSEIIPHFKRDDLKGGVRAGVTAILRALGGSYRPTQLVASGAPNAFLGISAAVFALVAFAFIVIIMSWNSQPTRNRRRRDDNDDSDWSSSSSGSSGSSSGGFSGGGGSFGGGGASGRW